MLKIALILFAICSVFCYEIPQPKFQLLKPYGFRAYIPDEDGITLLAFYCNLNKPLDCNSIGQMSSEVIAKTNGKWVYENKTAKINYGDRLYSCVFVIKSGEGYRLNESVHVFDVGMTYGTADLNVIPKEISSSDVIEDTPVKHNGANHKRRKQKNKSKHKGTAEMIPPNKPTIFRLNDESVMVRWSVPHNNGVPIQYFKVQYRELGPSNGDDLGKSRSSRWKTTNQDIAPNIHSYEVNNLKSDHIYKFRIAAVYTNNDNKLSPMSDKFHLVKEDFNSKNPLPIPVLTHTETLNSTSIRIFWEYTQNPNVTVDGFFISYVPSSSARDYKQETVNGEKTNFFVITHLQPDTLYDIKMQSFNMKSTSEFSEILKQKTENMQVKRLKKKMGHLRRKRHSYSDYSGEEYPNYYYNNKKKFPSFYPGEFFTLEPYSQESSNENNYRPHGFYDNYFKNHHHHHQHKFDNCHHPHKHDRKTAPKPPTTKMTTVATTTTTETSTFPNIDVRFGENQ